MEKKNIAITILIVALAASGIGNIILALPKAVQPPATGVTYVRSTGSGPATLEITDSWDSASNDVLEQVVETLFFYNLSNVDLPRINVLAQSYYWEDTTTLHIALREGILFHDGTPFNAVAAKWNLDRLLYLTNCTGTNTGEVAHTQSLWMNPDGVTPIIDSVVTVGTHNITITLNNPYAPFVSTLAYINAGMLSPTAHAAQATSFIPLTTGKPVGTGPFVYQKYVPNVEVRLTRWDGYWMAPANFPTVIFAVYSDATTAHNAMLSYTLDANAMASDQNIEAYKLDDKFTVKEFTLDTGKPSLVYQYMGINNEKYNVTWREVFALSTNYTYVIDELRLGNAIRANSAISPGYGASYNASALGPNLDITAARVLVQSMGFGTGWDTTYPGGTHEANWLAASFISVDYTYNTPNTFRANLYVSVADTFGLCGINVVDDGVTWEQFLVYLYDDFDHLGLYAIGWGPDYLDPYNMLDPLFNPVSGSNSAQVNDAKLNTMMLSCLTETDEGARNIIYQNIQGYMAQFGFFHIPLYHSKIVGVHLANIYGVPYNAMGALRIYPMYRGLFDPYPLI